MKINLKSNEEGIHWVALEGDLDFHSSPDVRRELAGVVEKQPRKILVNLSKVSYIDSSGLATFVELFQKIKRYGGKLVLFNLGAGVRSVFEIAKLDTLFVLAGNEQEALSIA